MLGNSTAIPIIVTKADTRLRADEQAPAPAISTSRSLAALKEINSKLATTGYDILERRGALKKIRLKSSASASSV